MNLIENFSTLEPRPSFSEVLIVWLYFFLLVGSAFYFLALIFFPFSESPVNHMGVLIFRILFLLIAPKTESYNPLILF